MSRDEHWMREALREAHKAYELGEVPIGAVLVRGEEVIARGHNLRESMRDPTAHAEILVLQQAAQRLGGWRLSGCTLYVTLEPCPMCAGALVQARVERLVYGAPDPKAGCAGTLLNLVQFSPFNHQLEMRSGLLQEECAALLQQFFRQLRKSRRSG